MRRRPRARTRTRALPPQVRQAATDGRRNHANMLHSDRHDHLNTGMGFGEMVVRISYSYLFLYIWYGEGPGARRPRPEKWAPEGPRRRVGNSLAKNRVAKHIPATVIGTPHPGQIVTHIGIEMSSLLIPGPPRIVWTPCLVPSDSGEFRKLQVLVVVLATTSYMRTPLSPRVVTVVSRHDKQNE